jgi:hypothetical protein
MQWTWFHPHKQRGGEAMEDAGIRGMIGKRLNLIFQGQ